MGKQTRLFDPIFAIQRDLVSQLLGVSKLFGYPKIRLKSIRFQTDPRALICNHDS